MNSADDAIWPGKLPSEVEALVLETVDIVRALDDTSPRDMTPFFYQNGYEQVKMSLAELLKILGHNPEK